eukprot:TRINITY_DN464_c0_g1_i2.p1 TRINITY_DN464_c0_g1~~TRINITY_DN464_c0_g1_i2.p1  ORF type:complete len:214 (+),score=51.69 TRINITY_DN464_c0_g1_i2:288-929(+)
MHGRGLSFHFVPLVSQSRCPCSHEIEGTATSFYPQDTFLLSSLQAKATTLKDALKAWEAKKGQKFTEATEIKLIGILPPIEKMDNSLAGIKTIKQLSLSSNNIDKIANLTGLDSLEILSLGRNLIKQLAGIEPVADTLKQLWISYNFIEKLNGIEKCKNLRVLYISNNKVEKWSEFEKLVSKIEKFFRLSSFHQETQRSSLWSSKYVNIHDRQ